MWVSRAAWQEVGGFDERFGRGYGEEVEFLGYCRQWLAVSARP